MTERLPLSARIRRPAPPRDPHHVARVADPEPTDGDETWPREQLVEWDRVFCERVAQTLMQNNRSSKK